MPPIYDYKCKKCEMETEVIRTIYQTDVLPTPDETPDAKPDQHKCETHDWEKLIKGKTMVVRGPNWGSGGKGYWAILLGFSLALLTSSSII